jgi:hypothetical protein
MTHAPTGLDLDQDAVLDIATPKQARALAGHLLDPDRDRPMVLISTQPGIGWAIDADAVHDAVTPLARVARLRGSRAAYALTEALPHRTGVYGSAGRVYPTGTAWAADPSASPLRAPRHAGQAAAAAQDLTEAALAAGYTHTRPRTCNCDQTRALRAQVRDLQRQLANVQHPPTRTTPPAAPHVPGPRRSDPPIGDLEARFRRQVANAWQQRIAAADHTGTPLPEDYLLNPGFLAGLERLTPGEYRKAASVAMEILTGLVRDLPGRHVHRMRTGAGGNNPDRRTPTGQFILRANLQTNTPAARRIHWTHTQDGRIQLLAVTSHDQPLVA